MNFIKKLFKASLILATITFISIQSDQFHNDYLRWKVGGSTVYVLSPAGFGGGTGFAVKGKSGTNYFMTNKHVCEAAINGLVKIEQGKYSKLKKVIYKDDQHDLCLVEGDSKFSALSLGSVPSPGDFHYIVGHPGLRQLTTSKGEFVGYRTIPILDVVKKRSECKGQIQELSPIEQFFSGLEFACIRKYRSYSTTAVAYPGNSGSAIVNKYGNVIAVLFAGGRQERDNYAVPLSDIVRVLNKF